MIDFGAHAKILKEWHESQAFKDAETTGSQEVIYREESSWLRRRLVATQEALTYALKRAGQNE